MLSFLSLFISLNRNLFEYHVTSKLLHLPYDFLMHHEVAAFSVGKKSIPCACKNNSRRLSSFMSDIVI